MKRCLDPTWQSSNWSFRSTWKGCYKVQTDEKKTILVHIKWNIVKAMDVNVKPPPPQNLTVPPPYIQEKTDKIVSLRLLQKMLAWRKSAGVGVTEGKYDALLYKGFREWRLQQRRDFIWGRRMSVTKEQNLLSVNKLSVNKGNAVFGVLISEWVNLQGMQATLWLRQYTMQERTGTHGSNGLH